MDAAPVGLPAGFTVCATMPAADATRPARPIALINAARCTGCGWCVPSCPWQLLSLETVRWRKTSTLHQPEACTGCAKCVAKCPFGVISMGPRAAKPEA
jgi:Na+-translocating ferredoxin:NAD+ oxidoreductase RNF subunit RnfB